MKSKHSKKIVRLRQETKLLWALILALVAVLFWILVSILSPKKQQVISPELRKLAEPLNPSLNQEVLNSLLARTYYEDEELETFSIFALIETEIGQSFRLTDIVNQRSALIEPQEQRSGSYERDSELLRMYSQQVADDEINEAQEPVQAHESIIQQDNSLQEFE